MNEWNTDFYKAMINIFPHSLAHLFSQYSTPSSLSSSNIHLLSIPWLYQVLSYLRDLSQAVCSAWDASLKIFPFHPPAFSVNNMSIVRPSLITQPEICFPLSLHPIDSFFFFLALKKNYLFIWLCRVLAVAHGTFIARHTLLSCGAQV